MMRPGLHIVDDADKTPPPVPGRHPLAPISGESWERHPRRLPAQVWVLITVVTMAPVALALYGIYRAIGETTDRNPWIVNLFGMALFSVAFVAVLSIPAWLISRAVISIQHQRVIRTRHGVPVDVFRQLAHDPLALEKQTIDLEVARAPYMLHPNLSTQSVTGMHQTAQDAPKLPTPIDVTPVPSQTWLTWLNRVPHVMLAAETGGGKTTLATHIVRARLDDPRASVYIIDPGASGWGGLPSVGGGEDWQAIKQAMINVIGLYMGRQKERAVKLEATGYELPHDFFPPLTVVLDEAFLAKLNLGSGKSNIWDRFVPVLGSGARKVGISVILLTQTANVEDLAISGPLRENYTRIALDPGAAVKFIQKTETDPTRKKALLDALQGQSYPAVTEQNGRCLLLDRSGMDLLPNMRGFVTRAWQPVPVAPPPTQEDETLAMLRRLKAQGVTRETARTMGHAFANDDWSKV